MLFWFIGTAVASIWLIFRDPKFDYRSLIVGAVLPDVAELWVGKAGPLHSVVTSVMLLAIVMVASIGARPRRKRLLAGVIGVFMHLVFDGAFLNTKIFWWPLSGPSFGNELLPSVGRGWWNLPLEILGVLLWVWARRQINATKAANE